MADPTDPTKHLNLLYEERLAKLVAPNKRLHGSIAGEKILNLTILIDALRGAQDWRCNHLQRS